MAIHKQTIGLATAALEHPPAVAQLRPRVFYGWWIVAACLAMLTLVFGIGLYGLGVFLPSLEREFGAGPTLVSLGAAVFFLVFGSAGLYVWRRVDLLGARPAMVVGSALFGMGLTGLALSQQLWQTYPAYAVIALGFSGTALISNWFRARRGLAVAVAMCGIPLGGVVMTPLATQPIVLYGWRVAALMLAVFVWLIGLPLSTFVVRHRPGDLGLLPDGATQSPAASPDQDVGQAGRTWTL